MKTRPRWMVARDVKEEESLWFRGGANLGFDFDFDFYNDDGDDDWMDFDFYDAKVVGDGDGDGLADDKHLL